MVTSVAQYLSVDVVLPSFARRASWGERKAEQVTGFPVVRLGPFVPVPSLVYPNSRTEESCLDEVPAAAPWGEPWTLCPGL